MLHTLCLPVKSNVLLQGHRTQRRLIPQTINLANDEPDAQFFYFIIRLLGPLSLVRSIEELLE